ncbi:MAG: alpha/beta hydrolase [Bacteroidetes bacterium]|nr:MAG: alpha/beta hydrolase [Bacteroidota bacterium]
MNQRNIFFRKIYALLEKFQLKYKASSVSYIRFGTGSRTAFCFHGYGEDAVSFSFLEKYAGAEYTFFAIDLPFHGHTLWNEGYTCSITDIEQIIGQIMISNGREPGTGTNKLTLLGYSLGARVALALYEKMSPRTDRLVLLAPDGLKVNFWYWLSTQTGIGNKLFAFTMKHPSWFFGFLKGLNKLRLVNASIFKFVNYYIGDKEVRTLLYARWTTLRKLKPNIDRIKKEINEHKTKVRLVYGMHDRIILSTVGEKFRKGIGEHCIISVIRSGHQVLHEKHATDLLPALLQ